MNKEQMAVELLKHMNKSKVTEIVGNSRVYILSKQGVDLCDEYYRHCSMYSYNTYFVLFKENIPWDVTKEKCICDNHIRKILDENKN